MDLEDRQKQLTRWIDGELEGDELREFEAMVESDPQLLEAKSEADQLRQLLSTHMPAREIPNAEFFNHQIQRRIAEPTSAPAAAAPPAVPAPLPSGGILSWFRSPFTLASAAAVIALGAFALTQNPAANRPADHTSVASTYTPDREIDAEHFYSDEADATVIMLDGLAALPDSTELKGQNLVSSEPGKPHKLYNEEKELALVVSQGADQIPVIHSF